MYFLKRMEIKNPWNQISLSLGILRGSNGGTVRAEKHTWLYRHVHTAFPMGILTIYNHFEFI